MGRGMLTNPMQTLWVTSQNAHAHQQGDSPLITRMNLLTTMSWEIYYRNDQETAKLSIQTIDYFHNKHYNYNRFIKWEKSCSIALHMYNIRGVWPVRHGHMICLPVPKLIPVWLAPLLVPICNPITPSPDLSCSLVN